MKDTYKSRVYTDRPEANAGDTRRDQDAECGAPAEGGSRIKIRMKVTVRPDWPFNFQKPYNVLVLVAGQIYEAIQNKHGAVFGICENGELMGVKPGEFEIIETE